ncbi:MAG: hypothetical protein JWM59_2596 [Verrucomicrobiales bacterium]|nr:hypothetical protein [Verrucomicrobiales bacterium]
MKMAGHQWPVIENIPSNQRIARMPITSRYSADLTAGSLKPRESRVIAGLLLDKATEEQWRTAIVGENRLQSRTSATALRLSRLIRSRLEEFDDGLWLMVRDGSKPLATQALLAAAVKDSALLRDFLELVLREEHRLFRTHLSSGVWAPFLELCQSRDPAMPVWREATRKRLRSSVFQILAQGGYLTDTTSRELRRVTILPELQAYLEDRREFSLLRTLQLS